MGRLSRLLLLDAQGEKSLRQAVLACTLTNLALMAPFSLTALMFAELLKPFYGQEVAWSQLWLYFGMGIAAFVAILLFTKNDYRKTYGMAYGQAEATRMKVAEHMRTLPMSFFNAKDLSELSANIVSDCTNMEQTMSSAIPQLIANAISSTLVCILLAFFDWRLALALFITLPVAALLIVLSRKVQARAFSKRVEATVDAMRQSQEYLEGIKVIRACGLGGPRFKALDDAYLKLCKASIRVELVSGSIMGVAGMVLRSGIGIVAFVGVALLTAGMLDFLPFLVFLLISTRIYGPMLTVFTLLPDLLFLKVSTGRLRELMDTPAMEGSGDIELTANGIVFDRVRFAYSDKTVLDDVSFTMPPASVTALVGPSGSGKSTVAQLAARFWDVQEGRVCVGGVDVKELEPEYLMGRFSFVFQDVILFNDTVENNIRAGRKDATDGEVAAAARAAYCDEFVNALPEGYQTLLGENGATLSGGQRQRLSIARALLKDAPIILLDEATASLDPENEILVQQAIGRLIEGKTVLVIAHRLRTVEAADNIIVLDEGKVVEQGMHESLMEQDGLYRKLYDIQCRNAQWGVAR